MPATNIALVSAPWPLFNRPSIQLGALKAYLHEKLPQVKVSAHHLYLNFANSLGYKLYSEISQSTWLAEPIAAALLYPQNYDQIQDLWTKKAAKSQVCKDADFYKLTKVFDSVALNCIDAIRWQGYSLVGFSICFSQLTSSLYLIKLIKKIAPFVSIVVGGAGCAGDMGAGLLEAFEEIDYAVHGEGELPLLELVEAISGAPGAKPIGQIAGLMRRGDAKHGFSKTNQISNLDELPVPDFEDYFSQLAEFPAHQKFHPRLPLEISRGCWWKNALCFDSQGGCKFCNLNLQWRGYRHKSAEKIKNEVEAVSSKYESLSISFMDNVLPPKGLMEVCKGRESLDKDFRLFTEIRATTPAKILNQMARAGMKEVQVGIEALSTSLLKKINKGTTAIQNLEIMKNCETPGLPDITGNLILEFPSSDQADVDETLRNLDFAVFFRPLKAIPFWLGYGSPIWFNPRKYGIKRISNHPYYRVLFPPNIFSKLLLIIQHYHGAVRFQQRIWRPVKDKVKVWHKTYAKLHESASSLPILYYEDGTDFLLIHQRKLNGFDMVHKLKGSSRGIYLFCQSQRHLMEIFGAFPGLTQEQIIPFLKMMKDKKLMFQEQDRFLSLAVPLTPR